MILVGLFGLGLGFWLSADAQEFRGIVLGRDSTSLRVYQSNGAVVAVAAVEGIDAGDVVAKLAGEPCCTVIETGGRVVSEESMKQLRTRYDLYWSKWSGAVEGFIMREHADDADTALIRTLDDSLIQWKVWEAHLGGLKRGEKLCKSAQSWAPRRCNPEAGVVEFQPATP